MTEYSGSERSQDFRTDFYLGVHTLNRLMSFCSSTPKTVAINGHANTKLTKLPDFGVTVGYDTKPAAALELELLVGNRLEYLGKMATKYEAAARNRFFGYMYFMSNGSELIEMGMNINGFVKSEDSRVSRFMYVANQVNDLLNNL